MIKSDTSRISSVEDLKRCTYVYKAKYWDFIKSDTLIFRPSFVPPVSQPTCCYAPVKLLLSFLVGRRNNFQQRIEIDWTKLYVYLWETAEASKEVLQKHHALYARIVPIQTVIFFVIFSQLLIQPVTSATFSCPTIASKGMHSLSNWSVTIVTI